MSVLPGNIGPLRGGGKNDQAVPSDRRAKNRTNDRHRVFQRAGNDVLALQENVRHCSPRLQRAMVNFIESAKIVFPEMRSKSTPQEVRGRYGGGSRGGSDRSEVTSDSTMLQVDEEGHHHPRRSKSSSYLQEGAPAAHSKWTGYAKAPSGNFPHPFKAGEAGLPYVGHIPHACVVPGVRPGNDYPNTSSATVSSSSQSQAGASHQFYNQKHPTLLQDEVAQTAGGDTTYNVKQLVPKVKQLPDSYLKPCANTSPMLYNYFRGEKDLNEHRQRELNFFVEAQHKFNREVAHLLNPNKNCRKPKNYMHATTKPCGRLYFDNAKPAFQLTREQNALMMPPGEERQPGGYAFWR